MIESPSMRISDVANVTERLHAELQTAKSSNDPDIFHAGIIAAVEGLLLCTRAVAFELLKVEIEGLDKPSL